MTFEEYKIAEEKRLEINIRHLENGVDFVDIRAAYIDETVKIGAGTVFFHNILWSSKKRISFLSNSSAECRCSRRKPVL